MANVTTTNAVDTFMQSADAAAMRTNLGLGDSATKAVGTTAGTVAAGNDSRIAGAVQTSRTVSAGTGLTGGGDLSADRTLAVSYGSSAGTSCQGNDSRLSNARTPTGNAGGDLFGNYPTPVVAQLYGRPLSSGAPSTGQVLGWTGSQWAPVTVSAGGTAEEYPILAVLFSGPTAAQSYSIPTGYKWADLFLCSGGQGGSGGEVRLATDGSAQSGAAGGNGGQPGTLRIRRKLWVAGAIISMDLGAGGSSGGGGAITSSFETNITGNAGGNGGDSRCWFSTSPTGSQFSKQMIARADFTDSRFHQPTFTEPYGAAANYQAGQPTITSWNGQETALVQVGSGGSGAPNSSIAPVIWGGVNADANGMLLDPDTGRNNFIFEGNENGSIDATTVPAFLNSTGISGFFFGGSGGAGVHANAPINFYNRGGDGAAGQLGCGGGGGGGCFVGNDLIAQDPVGARGGNGGPGGAGFLMMFLTK